MKFSELIRHEGLLEILTSDRPVSHFTGKPLNLIHSPLALTWENCMEKEWWIGANDGVYTHQIRIDVTDEQIQCAAEKAGIDAGEVGVAFLSRIEEKRLQDEERNSAAQAWSVGQAAKREERQASSRAAFASEHPELLDECAAKSASDELAALFRAHPEIDRMTRKLDMVDFEGKFVAKFTNLAGMKAWLFQNGFRASVDDRHDFVLSEK